MQTLYVVAEMNEEMKKKYSAIKLGLIKPLLAELQSKIEAEEAREPSSDEERIERLKAAKQNLEDHKELSERNVVGIDEKLKGASLTKILGR
ncbi:hypothetical protein J4206_06595 [Candidatus Woesearchaeota archaeon]|nr:hypothetical protein [Candidatus Woesearchaeota archaeon]